MSTAGGLHAIVVLLIAALVQVSCPLQASASDWVQYANKTATRLNSAPGLGSEDPDEKDYAVGDVDQDGDDDLVVVRKEEFTNPGKRQNILFMNEDGVLVDRTAEYAGLSSVLGDQGFLTATNDRDVQLVDVDQDGWLDIVTAVTVSDNDPKHIGHPRIYMNLGIHEGTGEWLGFKHEDARIPQMDSYSGSPDFNPRFCAVAAGDVTGDGYPDLWFGDYDSGVLCGCDQPEGADYNDRLLINQGNNGTPGYFDDLTQTRLLGTIQIILFGDQRFEVSNFGAAGAIADMNGDGLMDIVKQTSLLPPYYTGVAYNDPDNEGFFDDYEHLAGASSDAYFFSIGDLNNDNKNDIVVTNDAVDRYLLNTGTGADGRANFSVNLFPGTTAGFGSNSVIADLDNDGWNDVIIADVDVDVPGCTGVSDVLRNNADGPNVTFSADAGNIPDSYLTGVHDVAAIDINSDGLLDLVIGRCSSTEVWMSLPPVGVNFSYPSALPEFITPSQTTTFTVQLEPMGGQLEPGSVTLHYLVNTGFFNSAGMTDLGGHLFEGDLPAVQCTDQVAYYFSAQLSNGMGFTDPPNAPAPSYTTTAVDGLVVAVEDTIEADTSSWTIFSDPTLTGGEWEQAVPNGTIHNAELAAPDGDATPGGTMAFVTDNGPLGGAASDDDVDGGPTILTSPVIEMGNQDGIIAYDRWLFSSVGMPDVLRVELTRNGVDWIEVETVTGTNGIWEAASFRVGDFVEPSDNVQVRFSVCDCPNDSVTEAGVDNLSVTLFECIAGPCTGDLDNSGTVDASDLALLLGAWGPNPDHAADLTGDQLVNAADLAILLGAWGPC